MQRSEGEPLTFLFTDIVGSTRHWERNSPAMSAALARHDDLLTAIISRHQGVVFKTVGDAFCAVFATPANGVQAALAIQQDLATTEFDQIGRLQVRTALHTGPAEVRDGDYFGPVVNRVARLLAIGHGGQVLLSRDTADRVRDSLPPGTTLQDLGGHRLKDLDRPERVFQATIGELASDFPPLASLDTRPNNLPSQPDSLIGRDAEISALSTLLTTPDIHEVTICGPGGVGKTRLALAVGAEVSDAFPDGVWFVDLGLLSDPSLVLPTIARVLGVADSPQVPMSELIAEHLRDNTTLLILDTVEHVVVAAAEVSRLLARCPGVKVLATSRVPLKVRGEREFRLQPLAQPTPGEAVDSIPAVRLFVERVQAINPGFTLTNETRPIVAAICIRLEGLPLAIELAAARTRTMSLANLLTRLDRKLSLLTDGARDAPERQQTIRATIDWSYDLLSPPHQTLFRHLAMMPGGCTLTAAETLWAHPGAVNDRDGLDVLRGIDTLVAGNLLHRATINDDEPRFRMLDLVREYGLDQLDALGETDIERRRLATWCGRVAAEANAASRGPEQGAWLDRLEAEHNNLRAVLGWLLDQRDGETMLRLVHDLCWFWRSRGYLTEGGDWCARALGIRDTASPEAQALGLIGAANLAYHGGNNAVALSQAEESLEILQEANNPLARVAAHNLIGNVAIIQGDFDLAAARFNEAISLVRQEGSDPGRLALLLNNRGLVEEARGDSAAAERSVREALTIRRAIGDQRGILKCLHGLAILAGDQSDHDTSLTLLREALALSQNLQDPLAEADLLTNLGVTLLSLNHVEQARDHYLRALEIHRQHHSDIGIAAGLHNLGELELRLGRAQAAVPFAQEALHRWVAQGDVRGQVQILVTVVEIANALGSTEIAAQLLGASFRLQEEHELVMNPENERILQATMLATRDAIPAPAFDQAYANGLTLRLEETLALADKVLNAATGEDARAG